MISTLNNNCTRDKKSDWLLLLFNINNHMNKLDCIAKGLRINED